MITESKKGHNLVNFSRNLLKSQRDHLSIDLKPYATYQNLSSRGSLEIVLAQFFSIAIMAESKKGQTFVNRYGIRSKVNQDI